MTDEAISLPAPDEDESTRREEVHVEEAQEVPTEKHIAIEWDFGQRVHIGDGAASDVPVDRNVATVSVELTRAVADHSMSKLSAVLQAEALDKTRVNHDVASARVDQGGRHDRGNGARLTFPARRVMPDDDLDQRWPFVSLADDQILSPPNDVVSARPHARDEVIINMPRFYEPLEE